jgi:hypothetical protein
MTVSVNGTTGITFNDASTQNTAATGFGFKNRIINGAMMIDQRNAGASVTGNDYIFPVDRFFTSTSQTSKMTAQRNAGSVTPPTGYTNYLGLTSSSAYSVLSSDYFLLTQIIEGFNCADLAWGTASASPVTLSFWVRSSLTGTFGGSIRNSADNRSYPFSYTISAANTWEQKSITIAGDTTGTWLTSNNVGIKVTFGLGVGSTNSGTAGSWSGSTFFSSTGATSVVGTSGATFYITGVQLEKGSTATSFDYRPYGTELALCQRYAIRYAGVNVYDCVGMGYGQTSTSAEFPIYFPIQMRSQPSVTSSGAFQVADGGGGGGNVTAINVSSNQTTTTNGFVGITVTGGLTAGRAYKLIANNTTSASIIYSAEL